MGENTHSARHISRFSVKIWRDGTLEKAISLLEEVDGYCLSYLSICQRKLPPQ
jgi:hypothetical protein